jgi:two-component system C4-dicarboxylate transport sensor histidine kinase DctB
MNVQLPGEGRSTQFLAIHSAVSSTPWQMYSMAPTKPQIPGAVREARLIAFIILAAIATIAGLLLRRRQKVVARIAAAGRTQLELEQRVEERTRDLSLARDRLEAEISDHHRSRIWFTPTVWPLWGRWRQASRTKSTSLSRR